VSQPLGSRYVLHEMLGRGAMGQVFRANMRDAETPVAVKLLKPELVSDPELVARFIQERSILTSISHPNVVQIFDLVVEGDTLGIVMEYVAGQDLRHHLRRQGTLPPAEAVSLTRQILHGVAAVHASGIIHRDIKPENLLLGTSGEHPAVKLTDFGVARLSYGSSLTKRTSLIGTPEYMAPELADGGVLTPAADLYSVGILLYEMLGGETPFTGGHPLAVLRRHVEQPPVPIPDLPEQLWDYVDWLLAKDPASRPGSATDAAAALVPLQPMLAGLAALPPIPAQDVPATVTGYPGMTPPRSRMPHRASTPPSIPHSPQLTSWPAALGTGYEGRPVTAFQASDNGGTITRRRDRGSVTEEGSGPVPGASRPASANLSALQAGRQRPWDPRPWSPGLAHPRREENSAAAPASRRARTRRGIASRPMVLALPAAVVILVATIGFLVVRAHGAASASASSSVSYVFAAEEYPDGLTVVRRWTLSGDDGSQLTETVTANSTSSSATQLPFEEIIPTAIASSLKTVHFSPAPGKILRADPVVEWQLSLPAGHRTITVGYRAAVPAAGLGVARLRQWAADLNTEAAQLHVPVGAVIKLSSLSLSPGTVNLTRGSAAQLNLSGRLVTGGTAPAQILSGEAEWTTGNATVATVSSTGKVTAAAAGKTTVTAQIGPSRASATVTVVQSSQVAAGNGAEGVDHATSTPGQFVPNSPGTRKASSSVKATSGSTGSTGSPGTTGSTGSTGGNNNGSTGSTSGSTSTASAGTTTNTETAGEAAATWSNYTTAGGTAGAEISSGETVQVTCKVVGLQETTGNAYWYKIASSPWNDAFYAPTNYFYNNGQTSGTLSSTTLVDSKVPDC
jgi:serine/threonine protein kinase